MKMPLVCAVVVLLGWYFFLRDSTGWDGNTGMGNWVPRQTSEAEDVMCFGVNLLENQADAVLAADGTSPQAFEAARSMYAGGLAQFRHFVRDRFTSKLFGPMQGVCRSDSIARKIHAEGLKLPAAWRADSPLDGDTWGGCESRESTAQNALPAASPRF